MLEAGLSLADQTRGRLLRQTAAAAAAHVHCGARAAVGKLLLVVAVRNRGLQLVGQQVRVPDNAGGASDVARLAARLLEAHVQGRTVEPAAQAATSAELVRRDARARGPMRQRGPRRVGQDARADEGVKARLAVAD